MDMIHGQPQSGFDLGTGEMQGAIVAGVIDPDMFPTGGFGGADAGAFHRDDAVDAHFLSEFADGCRRIILAGIEVPGHAGIPKPRMHILEPRPLLEQKVVAFVENHHVH